MAGDAIQPQSDSRPRRGAAVTTKEHDYLWTDYWAKRAHVHVIDHNIERLMRCEQLRNLAARIEKAGV